MALKKQDLERDLTGQQKDAIRSFEKKIDFVLQERYFGSPVNVGVPQNTHPRVLKEVVKRFRRAGWSVEYHDNHGEPELFLS